MNHIYTSLFNPVTGTWVAVSETARSRGKRASTKGALTAVATATLLALSVSGFANAQPTSQSCVQAGTGFPPIPVPGQYYCSGDVLNAK